VIDKTDVERLSDRELLRKLGEERLFDIFFLQIRNLWRVDGLYFLGIEAKFGTEAATEIDAECWKTMAILEAKSLRKLFQIEGNVDLTTLMFLLRNTSWALDHQENKEIEITPTKAILRIVKCRTQEARLRKGLGEFPCKKVRYGYLKNFAQTLNPNIEVACKVCPPDKHPPDIWCEWHFIPKKTSEQ